MRQLMADFRTGNSDPASALDELFYPELRKLAAAQMNREREDHTWQATVLVNELYLQLGASRRFPLPAPMLNRKRRPSWDSRSSL